MAARALGAETGEDGGTQRDPDRQRGAGGRRQPPGGTEHAHARSKASAAWTLSRLETSFQTKSSCREDTLSSR